jgi:vacuolar-type H+-ATPase subunit F/Vma7
MARLVVLSGARLADGFRLAGAPTHVARPGLDAATAARGLAAEGDVGVLLITADLWASFDERLREALERASRPVVLPLPAAARPGEPSARQLLGEMLQRAIGYRIELGGTGREP